MAKKWSQEIGEHFGAVELGHRRLSRISANSPVQMPLNANGKNTSTTGVPRNDDSEMSSPCWFLSVKSGAASPMSRDMPQRLWVESLVADHSAVADDVVVVERPAIGAASTMSAPGT